MLSFLRAVLCLPADDEIDTVLGKKSYKSLIWRKRKSLKAYSPTTPHSDEIMNLTEFRSKNWKRKKTCRRGRKAEVSPWLIFEDIFGLPFFKPFALRPKNSFFSPSFCHISVPISLSFGTFFWHRRHRLYSIDWFVAFSLTWKHLSRCCSLSKRF